MREIEGVCRVVVVVEPEAAQQMVFATNSTSPARPPQRFGGRPDPCCSLYHLSRPHHVFLSSLKNVLRKHGKRVQTFVARNKFVAERERRTYAHTLKPEERAEGGGEHDPSTHANDEPLSKITLGSSTAGEMVERQFHLRLARGNPSR